MNEDKELIILSEKEQAYIGICQCCNKINLVYKNIAIKFLESEFLYFKKYFDELELSDFIFESKTGKNIFMASPTPNIVFCFSKEEVEEIRNLMDEAIVLLEVKKILQ